MPLQVIGAGFFRTGTHSLHLALEALGYRTHHMVKIIENPNQDPGVWVRAYENPEHEDEWEKVYGDFDAAVDFPTCCFYEELCKRYPDAKVILTVRTPESWYKSVYNTIYQKVQLQDSADAPEYVKRIQELTTKVALEGAFGEPGKFEDKEAMCKLFEDHIEQVKKSVPADRLLIMQLGDGWDKLCPFIGKDIPDIPYPRSNSTDEFNSREHNK